jgi:hypothetical protein
MRRARDGARAQRHKRGGGRLVPEGAFAGRAVTAGAIYRAMAQMTMERRKYLQKEAVIPSKIC